MLNVLQLFVYFVSLPFKLLSICSSFVLNNYSVDLAQELFGGVREVVGEDFNTLCVDVFGAGGVVFVFDVRELRSEALTVKVLFGVLGLVEHHLVGHLNSLEAGLLAASKVGVLFLVAGVEAVSVVRLGHSLGRGVQGVKDGSIESFLHNW